MKIAILGVRGFPARYGGFDTFVEELSLRLVKSGSIEVVVYCRNPYYKNKPTTINGVRLVYLPAPRIKALESIFHTFIASLHVISKKVDLIYFVDPANGPFCLLLRFFGKRVIVHTDGLGWKRSKWGTIARKYYKFVERICVKSANAIVTDNPAMKEYYLQEYSAESTFIAYGASNLAGENTSVFNEFSISPKNYFLVVARLEPENNVHFIIKEYVRSNLEYPLVIVGDSPYDANYAERLYKFSDSRVKFTGRINDQAKLNALYKNAFIYIHGHSVGGTNPSLLRAMNYGSAPLVLAVSFNKYVIADCGFVFEDREGELSKILEKLIKDPVQVKEIGRQAKGRVNEHFSWELVTRDHIDLFDRVARIQ